MAPGFAGPVPTLAGVSTEPIYTYLQLADRMEQVLGARPSLSSLRAAASEARRTQSVRRRPRLTLGMPAPQPSPSPTAPALFSQAEMNGCGSPGGVSCGGWDCRVGVATLVNSLSFLAQVVAPVGVEVAVAA